jgi:hypothetical protein
MRIHRRAAAETMRGLDLVGGRLAARRNALAPARLPEGVVDVLIGVRLVAAQVVFGLVPIPLQSRLGAFPRRIVVIGPPARIFSACRAHVLFFQFVANGYPRLGIEWNHKDTLTPITVAPGFKL